MGVSVNSDALSRLLLEQEGPAVEFKRHWYGIDAESQQSKNRQRDELIKDVLALANGSVATAGEPAYLIIGAGDTIGDSGRPLYGAEDFPADAGQRVLQLVSSACSPALSNITSEVVTVGDHSVGVLTIHPTPHVHETTRVLNTPSCTYSQHVAFIRSGDTIQLASASERAALLRRKEQRFREYRNVSPVLYGAALGAAVGAMAALTYATQEYSGVGSRLAAMLVGAVVFGFVGWVSGLTYRQVSDVFHAWHRIGPVGRFFALAILLGLIAWLGFAFANQIAG